MTGSTAAGPPLAAVIIIAVWVLLLLAYGWWKWHPRGETVPTPAPVDHKALARRLHELLEEVAHEDVWFHGEPVWHWPSKRTMTPPPEHVSSYIMLRSVVAVHNTVYGRRS